MDVRFLGHACFALTDGDTTVLIDPFLTGNPKAAASADEVDATTLRPEFGATFTRGSERVLGTCLGVGLAGAIAVALHPAGGVTIIIVGLLAWAGYATFPASFAVGYAFITLVAIAVFGWLLERRHGSVLVLTLFLIGGVGGLAANVALHPDAIELGASGAALAMACAWSV